MDQIPPPASAVGEDEVTGAGPRSLVALIAAAATLWWAVSRGPDSDHGDNAPPAVGPRAEFLAIAKRLIDSEDPYLGTRQLAALKQRASDAMPESDRCRQSLRLGLQLLTHGDVDGAIGALDTAALSIEQGTQLRKKLRYRIHFWRAVCYLRRAEVVNCIRERNGECCVFPLAGGGLHADAAPARAARESLLDALAIDPEDLPSRWLLNLVCMAIDEHPGGVPERWLIPESAFDSDFNIGRFEEVGAELGVDAFNLCGGVVVDDMDGDGRLDIVTSTFDPSGALTYYRNDGERFEDRSAASGLNQQLGGLNCLGADYDNDGDLDVLVLRGAWLHDNGRIRNSLLRNNGDGTFTDVTRAAGLADPASPTQAATWGDFDLDGDLDLYVGNESRLEVPNVDQPTPGDYPSQLFQNNGDGTFTDVAAAAGVTNDRYCKGVAAGDFDNDGDLDLYVSNVGPNRLYRNEGNGRFLDVAPLLGVTHPDERSFATWFFDYDNDGWLDLFVAAYQADLGDVTSDHLGLPHDGVSPRLYRNDRSGGFTDVTSAAGLDHPWLPMGASFGDLDNDGYLDLYLATGEPGYHVLTPNVMLRNDGGERFQNVTTSGGFGHLQKGHGVVFADLDDDGDQDIYHQLGGFYPGDGFANALFLNPGHGHRFLSISLEGQQTNRSGLGARLRVRVQTPAGPRTVHRAVGSVSSFGGTSRRQEIGLGDATRIDAIEIDWPVSATTQVIEGVELDARIIVSEGTPGFRRP
ncbi:MAG: CRTAC1 family protein [Planctomycetota bacterium]|nr:CRTAC1 family protein [Planctomycetota bacterium]